MSTLDDLNRLEEMKSYLADQFSAAKAYHNYPAAAACAQAYATIAASVVTIKDSETYRKDHYNALVQAKRAELAQGRSPEPETEAQAEARRAAFVAEVEAERARLRGGDRDRDLER